jgi:tetratricopeptide (TPR) repeat protein
MTAQLRTHLFVAALLSVATWPDTGYAFRKVAVGAALTDIRLKPLEGKKAAVFSADTKVNLFIFFRPDQDYSRTTLAMLARICSAYSKRGVNCAAIVSDYYTPKAIGEAVKAAGWPGARTFIDKEDLYNDSLGVILYPEVGVADGSRKLRAFHPFTKVNYGPRIEADVRYLLGELNEKQLQSALIPAVQEEPTGKIDTARIDYNYAKRLLDAGKPDKAVTQAERALSIDPNCGDAYALIALIRSQQGRCDLAKPLIQKALALDKSNAQATKAAGLCQTPRPAR